jgi:hypothetical protein
METTAISDILQPRLVTIRARLGKVLAQPSGCGQTPVQTASGGDAIAIDYVDQQKQLIFVPIVGDSDVAVLDGHACRAGHADACHVKIAKERAGGFPVTAAVDESTATVYVVNDDDGTVSLFPSSR